MEFFNLGFNQVHIIHFNYFNWIKIVNWIIHESKPLSIVKIFNVLLYSILTHPSTILLLFTTLTLVTHLRVITFTHVEQKCYNIKLVKLVFDFEKVMYIIDSGVHVFILKKINSYITYHKNKKSLNNCEGWKYLIYHFHKQLFWQYCHMTHSSMYNVKCHLMWIHKILQISKCCYKNVHKGWVM
jgi:hypothetical protein